VPNMVRQSQLTDRARPLATVLGAVVTAHFDVRRINPERRASPLTTWRFRYSTAIDPAVDAVLLVNHRAFAVEDSNMRLVPRDRRKRNSA
jgi:hypothetical protein